ncbi:MAG: copper resistance protein CopC [Micrococcales bacterium]
MKKFAAPLFAAIALLVAVLTPAPAFAHDELVSSYPEANSSIEANSFSLNVTFNEDAMQVDGNTGFGFIVTAPDGKEVPTGCLSVAGAEVSAYVSVDQPGEYKVDWRAVSADGHPNSGSFKFNVTNTTNFVAEPDIATSCELARTTTIASPMPLIAPAPTAVDDSKSSSSGSFTWIGLTIGAVLIVLGSVAGALRVRSKERKAAENPEILSDDK